MALPVTVKSRAQLPKELQERYAEVNGELRLQIGKMKDAEKRTFIREHGLEEYKKLIAASSQRRR